jgi:glutathione S-transferase
VAQHDWSGVDLEPFPNLARWFAQLGARPAVKRGMDVPSQDAPVEQRLKTADAIITR